MRFSRSVVCVISLACPPAFAGQGEVCLSKPVPAPATGHFDNTTAFECKTAGKLTASGLSDTGWRIVPVFPQAIASGTTRLQLSSSVGITKKSAKA